MIIKDLNAHKNSAELSMIIKSLIKFIVIDGQKHVKKDEQILYISKYIYTLSSSLNGHSAMINMKNLTQQIEKDIRKLPLH